MNKLDSMSMDIEQVEAETLELSQSHSPAKQRAIFRIAQRANMKVNT